MVGNLLEKTRGYRSTGFSDAQTTAKKMSEEMNVHTTLKEKRKAKRHFNCESPDESFGDSPF